MRKTDLTATALVLWFTASAACGDWSIRSTCGTNGIIEPAGVVWAINGGTPGFAITPTNNYHIAEIYTNGVPCGFETNGVPCGFKADKIVDQTNTFQVTFGPLTDHATIHAEFARNDVSGYALGTPPPASGIAPAILCLDVSNLWVYAACGAMPVDNSNQWAMALANGWDWPPLSGAMPVAASNTQLVVAYPPLKRPTAPLDLSVAALPGGQEFDLYWRFDDDNAEAHQALLECRDLDTGSITNLPLITRNSPFINTLSLTPGNRYAFRIAAKGNGYFSDYSEPFVLSTYVTNGFPQKPGLSPVVNVVTVKADVVGMNWPSGGAEAVIHGSQSGTTRTARAVSTSAGKSFSVATSPLLPGEEAWVVVTAQTNGPHATVATPHAWRTVGDVRFGGGGGFVPVPITNAWFDQTLLVDVDHDEHKHLDILACVLQQDGPDDKYYRLEYWRNTGSNAFLRAGTWTSDSQIAAIAQADLDGSGTRKLLAAINNTLYFFRADALHLGPQQNIQFDNSVLALQCADMDVDGDVDLVVGCDGPNVILLNNGFGVFHRTPQAPWESRKTLSLAIADFNRDGYPDVVCGNDGVGLSSVWFGQGNGLLHLAQEEWTGWDVNTSLDSVAAEDIDGDGCMDIVFAGYAGGALPKNKWWKNNRLGLFNDAFLFNEVHMNCMAVADVMGSEQRPTPSIIGARRDEATIVHFWQYLAGGSTATGPENTSCISAGDLNGDGAVDLLFAAGENATVLLNQPPPPMVTGLQLFDMGVSHLKFVWQACPQPVNAYEIRLDRVAHTDSYTNYPSQTNTVFGGLADASTYLCKVRATNSFGAGPWSASLTATPGTHYQGVLVTWLKEHFPNNALTEDLVNDDQDKDGVSTRDEYEALTDPTESTSRFEILSVAVVPGGSRLSWQAATNRIYEVLRATDLGVPDWGTVTNLSFSSAGTNALIVPHVDEAGFYRLRVRIQ